MSEADPSHTVEQINAFATQAEQAKQRIDDVERHIGEQKGKIDSDTQTVGATKTRFDDLKSQAETLHGDLASQQSNLQAQVTDIQAKLETLKNLEQELIQLKNSATTAKDGAEANHQAIQNQQTTFEQTIEQVKQKVAELTTEKTALKALITEIDGYHKAITTLYNEMLVDKEEEGKITKSSTNRKLNDLLANIQNEQKNITATHTEQKESFAKLYEQLNAKILSLLPGAGAAGLASSYYSAKLRYSPTNDILTDSTGAQKKLSKRKFWSQFISLAFNYALFIFPLVMIYEAFEGKTLADFNNSITEALIYKITVTLPMLALSAFGLASILSNRRLYEEYNHKQRVMELYHSFKEEIEETKDPELRVKLLHLMLDVVKDKPAKRLDQHEKNSARMLQTIVDDLAKKAEGG